MHASSQRFIARHRAPRVQIEYTVSSYGSDKMVQLPFVTGVLADLSGMPADPLPPVDDRKFLAIDVDNFEERLKSQKPRLAFEIPNTLTGEGTLPVEMVFESIHDFHPGSVAHRVSPLSDLFATRLLLKNLQAYLEGKPGAQALITELLGDPEQLRALALLEGEEGLETEHAQLAERIGKEFGVKTPFTSQVLGKAIPALAAAVLQHPDKLSSPSALTTLVTDLDRKMSDLLNPILHHPQFQQLEATWCGLHYLVTHTETDEMLKIRVLNISKQDLRQTLKKYKGTAWQESPIFRRVVEDEYGQLGGEPYGLLVGDYAFDHTPRDTELLGEIANIAAFAQTPFIAAASPTLMGMDSWQELSNPRDLRKIFMAPDYALWRTLRQTDQARYLALVLPRALARLPHGRRTAPVEELDFEEDVATADHARFVWMNAAYLMATNIHRAFKRFGWCARIEGVETGGVIERLPLYQVPADGGFDTIGATEIALGDRRAAELVSVGLVPLQQRKNSNLAAFLSAPSLQKPPEFTEPTATTAAKRSASLPFVLACSRFAHHLKCICRDRAEPWSHVEEAARWLNDWAKAYVDDDPAVSTEESKARRPLAAAEVVLSENGDDPGHYDCRFFIRPQYQLDELPVSIRLNLLLPTRRAGQ